MPPTAEKSVKTPAKTRKSNEKPSVYKKSPQSAMEDLFKSYLGPKSDIVKALSDNGIVDSLEETSKLIEKSNKDAKTQADLQKKMLKSMTDNSTKLSAVTKALEQLNSPKKSAKTEKTEKNISELSTAQKNSARHLETVSSSLKKMRALLIKQNQDMLDRSLQHEANAFEGQLHGRQRQQQAQLQGSDAYRFTGGGNYRLNPIEQRATQLFGKGFHFVTGVISEVLQKSILHNKSPMLQENKPEEEWSPQHREYMRTKEQLAMLFNLFKPKDKTVAQQLAAQQKGTKSDEKLEKIEKEVRTGNAKIDNDINSMHVTLRGMADNFATQTKIMLDDQEEAKLRNSKIKLAEKKAPYITNIMGGGAGGKGIFGTALDAGKAILEAGSTIIAGLKKVVGAVSAAATGAIASAKALAMRPVGLAAGVGTIGAAAIGAAYFMDKYSREMMDATTEQTKSDAALSMQRSRMKRLNPQAYELVTMRDHIQNMETLRDSQKDPQKRARTQKAIDELNTKYWEKYHADIAASTTPSETTENENNNATTETTTPTPNGLTESKASKVPIAGSMGAGVASTSQATPVKAEGSFTNVVNELRNGRLTSILEDIRSGINNLQSALMNQGGVKMMTAPIASGPDVSVGTKSSIARQRDALRTQP